MCTSFQLYAEKKKKNNDYIYNIFMNNSNSTY